MNCPVCNVALQMTDRQGVEIDYCQKCRGVWLDRGELDKILERSRGTFEASEAPRDRLPGYAEPQRRRDHDDDEDYRFGRKRKNWLEDLFD